MTVSAGTLSGADPQPARLEGYGYLPAPVALDLVDRCGGVLRRLLTDPLTGAVVAVDSHTHDLPPWSAASAVARAMPGGAAPGCSGDHRAGPGAYRPGRLVDRLVRARSQRCTAPGCSRPAVRCDLDHALAWPAGPTCPWNLHPVWRRHHRMKHAGRTRVRVGPDGAVVWQTGTGHQYGSRPPPALATPRASSSGVRPQSIATLLAQTPVPAGHDTARWAAAALRAALAQAGVHRPESVAPAPADPPPPF